MPKTRRQSGMVSEEFGKSFPLPSSAIPSNSYTRSITSNRVDVVAVAIVPELFVPAVSPKASAVACLAGHTDRQGFPLFEDEHTRLSFGGASAVESRARCSKPVRPN